MDNFRRLVSYSRPYWRRMLIAALGALMVGGMDGAFAFISGKLLKQLFHEANWTYLNFVPLAVIIIFILRGLGRFINDYFIRTAGQMAIQDIRSELFGRNIRLSLGYFSRQQTGALMSRVMNDVNMMQEGVGQVVTGLFRDGLGALFILGVIFYLNWKLAIIAFLVLPATVWPAQKIGKRIKNAARQSQNKMGILTSLLQESFAGIKVLKAFNLEERESRRFAIANKEFFYYVRKGLKYEGLSLPLMEGLSSFGVAGVFWAGLIMVKGGTLKAEDLISFIVAMVLLYNPVKKLNTLFNSLQRSLGSAERVFAAMDEIPEITDPKEPVPFGRAQGQVTFTNVSFCYGEESVLRNINVHAERGQVVALVGPSGAGKTTMVSLIPRFYDVTGGSVAIDGIDVRTMSLNDVIAQIALVDQETTLFNDTLANNIRYGLSNATDEQVEVAAKAAFAHGFISEFPDGYATQIGDRGVRLSGGQRQRICIARAILKNAPILILDEATSALDTESEQMVQQALTNLMANRTTFVIAHRLSTVLHADRIVVLDKGSIVEAGTHAELIARNGLYRKLYDMQFAE